MATYVYGNKITAGNDWRTWMSYEVSTSNTAVTVTVKMGFETIGGWVQSGKRVYTLTGTGQTSGSYTESNVKLANSTKHTKITRTWTWNRTTSAQTKYIQAKTVYSGSNQDGTSTTSSIPISVPALPSYTVAYNANGGSGAPASQTKWYNTTLALQSGVPSRTGYTLKTGTARWNTASGGTGTGYASGGSYTANAAATLYAQWTENTATLTYNANGHGTAPSAVTMRYTAATTAASMSASGWVFKGWNTKSDGTGTAYASGATVKSANVNPSALTLYAQWVTAYVSPAISNIKAERGDYEGGVFTKRLSGDYVQLSFGWSAGQDANGIKATSISVTTEGTSIYSATSTSASGTVTVTPHAVPLGSAQVAVITVTDTTSSPNVTVTKFIQAPKGGFPVVISRTENCVRFFGLATDDDEGVISDDYIIDLNTAVTSGTDYELIQALTNIGWSDLI